MGMGGQHHAPVALPPQERPGTHCIGGWMGPRAGLDGCEKSCLPPGFDSRTTQSVGSRYTDPHNIDFKGKGKGHSRIGHKGPEEE